MRGGGGGGGGSSGSGSCGSSPPRPRRRPPELARQSAGNCEVVAFQDCTTWKTGNTGVARSTPRTEQSRRWQGFTPRTEQGGGGSVAAATADKDGVANFRARVDRPARGCVHLLVRIHGPDHDALVGSVGEPFFELDPAAGLVGDALATAPLARLLAKCGKRSTVHAPPLCTRRESSRRTSTPRDSRTCPLLGPPRGCPSQSQASRRCPAATTRYRRHPGRGVRRRASRRSPSHRSWRRGPSHNPRKCPHAGS